MMSVRHVAVVVATGLAVLGCATGQAPAGGSGAPATGPAVPRPPAAALDFPTRSGVFEAAAGPRTPALKALQGRVPLVHLTRKSLRRGGDPGYELALFDDGTLMYEGARCVRLGGLVLQRLEPAALAEVEALLAESCVKRPTASADEVCPERGGLVVACAGAEARISSTDRCVGATGAGAELQAFAEEILARTGVDDFIGAPTERLACDALSADMGTGEITRTLTAPAAPAVPFTRPDGVAVSGVP